MSGMRDGAPYPVQQGDATIHKVMLAFDADELRSLGIALRSSPHGEGYRFLALADQLDRLDGKVDVVEDEQDQS